VAHAGQEGLTGRHRLADMFAICRTETVDEQQAGRRATVSALNEGTGVWHVVHDSAVTRTLANDKLATYFNGQGWRGSCWHGRPTRPPSR